MAFDAKKVKEDIIKWIRDWFEVNGKGCNAIVAISGGKDSSVVAALCVEALGKDRVIGVLLPKGEQFDIDVSLALVEHLGIKHYVINIEDCFNGLISQIKKAAGEDAIQTQTITNLPPRLRMAATYAVSQSFNGRVANTCNLSEDWVGYATRYGDGAGDFSPLSKLTVQEVENWGCLRCLWTRLRLTACSRRPTKKTSDSLMQCLTTISARAKSTMWKQKQESTACTHSMRSNSDSWTASNTRHNRGVTVL